MIRVDQKFMDIASRIMEMDALPDGVSSWDVFILGGSFQAAWLTGCEIRAGHTNIPPMDMREYERVRDALQKLGWLDLLEE